MCKEWNYHLSNRDYFLIMVAQYRVNWIEEYCGSHVLVQPNFRLYYFNFFARSSSNSPWSFQRFRQTLRRNFNWIRQQMKNFPIDPHCKNCPWPALGLISVSLENLNNSSPKPQRLELWYLVCDIASSRFDQIMIARVKFLTGGNGQISSQSS